MHPLRLIAVLLLPFAACCAPHSAAPAPAAEPAASTAPAPDYAAVVAATDRTEEDRALDAGRQPAKLLAFLGLKSGAQVGEICAGTGYTTELLARTVGPTGKVYAENPRAILEKFAEAPWAIRLKKPALSSVVRSDQELETPFPVGAPKLDAVVDVLFYHDTVWLKADRAKMNKAIFEALKPGGFYVIVDHSARAGTGIQDAGTLHRIEESTVKSEIEGAGFKFVEAADFLRNPSDARNWSASPRVAAEKRGTSDRFVLKFVRP